VRRRNFFVNNEIFALQLDLIGKRYNKLPSELKGKDITDLQFDYWCLELGIKNEKRVFEEHQKRSKGETIVKTGYRKKHGR